MLFAENMSWKFYKYKQDLHGDATKLHASTDPS